MRSFWAKRKIVKYRRWLAKHGDDAEYFQKVAELYGQISQPMSAVEYYEKAIKAYYREDSRLGAHNDFILHLCWKLFEIDPLNVLACTTLGQEYCGLGEFEEAVELYTSFAGKLVKAAQYDKAIEQYRNALVLVPGDVEVRQRCFALLWRLRRTKEAVQELRKIAELAEHAGNVAKALECYKKAVKIMPSDSVLQTELNRLRQQARAMETPFRLVVNT
jgi:tetratricopeptide (TPR) repeat protein